MHIREIEALKVEFGKNFEVSRLVKSDDDPDYGNLFSISYRGKVIGSELVTADYIRGVIHRKWPEDFPDPRLSEECNVKNVKEILQLFGLNIKQLSERFEIPYRTAQNWANGSAECSPYILKMMYALLYKDLR